MVVMSDKMKQNNADEGEYLH